jgi:hypothetical protein
MWPKTDECVSSLKINRGINCVDSVSPEFILSAQPISSNHYHGRNHRDSSSDILHSYKLKVWATPGFGSTSACDPATGSGTTANGHLWHASSANILGSPPPPHAVSPTTRLGSRGSRVPRHFRMHRHHFCPSEACALPSLVGLSHPGRRAEHFQSTSAGPRRTRQEQESGWRRGRSGFP